MKRENTPATDRAWLFLLACVALVPISNSVFAAPLLGHALTYDTFNITKVFVMRVTLLLALTALIFSWRNGGAILRRHWCDAVAIAVVAWVGLSAVFSISIKRSVFGQYGREEGLLVYLGYVLVYFLVVQLADKPGRIRKLAEVLVYASMPVAFYGLVQYFGADPMPWAGIGYVGRAFSTYANPEPLGGFLIFSAMVAISLAISERRVEQRTVWWAATLLGGACLLVTFTRAAWIGMALALTGFVVTVVIKRLWRWHRVDGAMIGVAGLALLGIGVFSFRTGDQVTNVLSRVKSLAHIGEGSAATRTEIWSSTIQAIAERPLLGFGPDTFELFFPAFRTASYFHTAEYLSWADNAHSYPLHLASTMGVPGAVLLCGFFLMAFWLYLKAMVGQKARRSDTPEPPAAVADNMIVTSGFAWALLGYFIYLLFSMSTPGVTLFAWIAAGVIVSPHARRQPLASPQHASRLAVSAAVMSALLAAVSFVPIFADASQQLAQRPTPWEGRMAPAERSVKLAPYRETYRRQQYVVHAGAIRQAVLEAQGAGRPVPAELTGRFDTVAFQMDEALVRAPWYLPHYEFYCMATNFAGSVWGEAYSEKAVDVATQGLDRFPNTPTLLYERAVAETALGDPVSAQHDLARALELEPRYTEAVLLSASVLADEGQGNVNAAKQLLLEHEEDVMDQAAVRNALSAIEQQDEAQ